MKSHILIILVLSVIALVLGLGLNYALSSKGSLAEHDIEGLLWPQTKMLTPFTLTDQHGQPFTLDNFKDKWSLVFFGYTHCPDVCPTTLTVLKGVKQKLADSPQATAHTQYVFVSVDGERDTPEVLAKYMNYFDPTFIGLSGSEAQVNSLTQQLGIVYMRIPGANEENYLVDHSAQILLFDPLGRMIALFSAPHVIDSITSRYLAIRQLLNQEY